MTPERQISWPFILRACAASQDPVDLLDQYGALLHAPGACRQAHGAGQNESNECRFHKRS